VDCYIVVGNFFPADDGISKYEMESSLTPIKPVSVK
jgi:hypothetical protein